MQRFYGEKRDVHGRVEAYATISVYESGTDTLATLYDAFDTADIPSNAISNPMTADANGRYAFAANNGDYDIVCTGSGSAEYKTRVNLFDSTTSSSGGAGGSNTQVQYNSGGVLTGASGLTTDGASLTARSVLFDTSSPVTTNTQGNTYWDSTYETISTVLDPVNGVILQHGQELHIQCVNKTLATITNGQAVYINDAQGNRPTCALALADSLTTCQVVGVATQDIAKNAAGLITVLGRVGDINTSGYTADGKTLYLSAVTPGALTETAPSSPNYVVRVGVNLNTTISGALFVNPNRALAADTAMAANTNSVPPTQAAAKAYANSASASAAAAALATAEAYTDTLRSDLASTADVAKGDELIGVKSSLSGGTPTTQHAKNSNLVDAEDFGVSVGNSAAVNTSALNAALISCQAAGKTIVLNANYPVTNIVINGLGGLSILSKGGGLVGQDSGTYNAVLEIRDTPVLSIVGSLGITAAYNTNYTAGVWVYSTGTPTAQMDLENITVNAAKVGWKFGHETYPDALVSEITVRGGYTYGCPTAIKLVGTQTVVSFIGCRLQSNLGSNPSGWSSLEASVVSLVGSGASIVGGECLQTAITTGVCFRFAPITSATYGNPWPTLIVDDVIVETASQLMVAANPGGVATPGVGASQGGFFNISNSAGFHAKNGSSFMQTSSDYLGTVKAHGNKFLCNTATETTITAGSSSTTVDFDTTSFGTNFSTVYKTADTAGSRRIDGATEGTFTPSFTNLTVVNGTGGATYIGNWTRIGRLVFWSVKIAITGTCTTASTGTSTYINNLPFTVVSPGGTFGVADSASTSLGEGIYAVGLPWALTPTWGARPYDIYLSGFFPV